MIAVLSGIRSGTAIGSSWVARSLCSLRKKIQIPLKPMARGPSKGAELSERERQILALVARGLTDRQIGERLFISTSTVRSHLDRISKKTGLRRRGAHMLAVDLGVVA